MEEKINGSFSRSITLPNDVRDVPLLAGFIDEVCEELGIDMTMTMQLNLAMEEAVVNVMSYAYPKGEEGKVNVDVDSDGRTLRFVISDHGTPFDPTTKAEVDTTLPAESRNIGGLGIHLIRSIMDETTYERVDDMNVLTLVKKLK